MLSSTIMRSSLVRSRIRLVALLATSLCLAAPALAQQPQPSAYRRARELVRGLIAPGQKLTPGQRARVRGLLLGERPAAEPTLRAPAQEHRDAAYLGRHPMVQRLAASGWYRDGQRIARLQSLADGLRATRAIAPTTPLGQVELLAFDLEASGGSAGYFDRKQGKLRFGWDEVTQFGYTIYRGGAKVSSGTINIKPDVSIAPVVQRITGLNAAKLAGAARFEDVAEQLLTLMQGRVLVGQGSLRNDWSWLQSSFARLGVDLPGPRGMMLDTHVLSFHAFPAGAGLKALVEKYGAATGRNHDAGYDASATGEVLQAMLREHQVATLGDAFRLQEAGQVLMHQPRPQPQPAQAAAR